MLFEARRVGRKVQAVSRGQSFTLSVASGGARFAPVVATMGASVSVLTIYAEPRPGPLLSSLHGSSVSAVVVFVAFTVCSLWTLRHSSPSAWRWATGIGVVFATAQLAGLSLRSYGGLIGELRDPKNLAWVIVHWLGTAWMVMCGLAALIGVLDSYGRRTGTYSDAGRAEGSGAFARLVDSLRASNRARRRAGWLTVMGILVLSRLPYLLVYWPGIVAPDTSAVIPMPVA